MNNKIFKMTVTAMFTAMIFVLTRFLYLPVATGYVHFGDALVYLVASLLGGPWAFIASCFGEAIADVSSGWVIYAPATLIIKLLTSIPFVLAGAKNDRILTPLTALLTIPSGVITVGGYFIADLIINKAFAIVNITGNVIQAVASALIFIVISGALDTTGIKKRYFN